MRELGLTGLSEDGRFLIAHDALTDESFHIPTDIRLTSLLDVGPEGTAKHSDREAGTREPTMEVTLSPREIQARIRRGESPEQVADDSGMPLEKVRGFAVPVIAEREFIVEQARKTSVRRLHASGAPGMLLGSLVDSGLGAIGASAEAAHWDSWRCEDGRWTVVVAPEGAAQSATFLFDTKGRYILPADDAAHELIGDVALQETPEMAIADAVREQPHVVDPVADDIELEQVPEAGLFEREIVEIESNDIADEVLASDIVDDLYESEVTFDLPVADEIIERRAQVSSLKEARDRRALEQLSLSIDSEAPIPEELSDVEITERQNLAVPSTPHPSTLGLKKRHERRRVPSWDEIMFGGTHPE